MVDILKLSEICGELISCDCCLKKNLKTSYRSIVDSSLSNDILLFPSRLHRDNAKVHGAAYKKAWQMHPVPLMTHSAAYMSRIVKGATRGRCRVPSSSTPLKLRVGRAKIFFFKRIFLRRSLHRTFFPEIIFLAPRYSYLLFRVVASQRLLIFSHVVYNIYISI